MEDKSDTTRRHRLTPEENRRHNQRPSAIEARKRYAKSPKGKAAAARYFASPKGQAAIKRAQEKQRAKGRTPEQIRTRNASPAGQAAQRRYRLAKQLERTEAKLERLLAETREALS